MAAKLMFLHLLCVLNAWKAYGADENTYQQYIGCEFNNQGQTGHFWRYGYNSKDIMHINLTRETMVPSSEAGQFLANERKSVEYVKKKEHRLMKLCSVVQTVFLQSNNSLSKAVKPSVYVWMEGEEGREFLVCQVSGFYPNVIRVQWSRFGRPVYYGTSTTGILPHKDGTFQMTKFLSLSNTSAHGVTCDIEHISIDGKIRATLEEKPVHVLLTVVLAVISFFVGIAVPAGTTKLIIQLKEKQPPTPSEGPTNDSSEGSETPPSVSLMNLPTEL